MRWRVPMTHLSKARIRNTSFPAFLAETLNSINLSTTIVHIKLCNDDALRTY